MSATTSGDYVFDRGETDQERLKRIAQRLAEEAREACLRADLGAGGRAIDVGCGPIGALPVLAELVGPSGSVVGLDVSEEALAEARQTCARVGLGNVSLVRGDLNAVDAVDLAPHAPFDLAFCRLVLDHQPDPAASLRRIAGLLRSGGRIVAQDPIDDPSYPLCDPPVPAVRRVFELVYAGIGAKGGSPDVARRYRDVCKAAGLRVASHRGSFLMIDDPRELLSLSRAYVGSMRQAVVAGGLTTEEELGRLDRELAEAATRPHPEGARSAIGPLMVTLTAEGP